MGGVPFLDVGGCHGCLGSFFWGGVKATSEQAQEGGGGCGGGCKIPQLSPLWQIGAGRLSVVSEALSTSGVSQGALGGPGWLAGWLVRVLVRVLMRMLVLVLVLEVVGEGGACPPHQ